MDDWYAHISAAFVGCFDVMMDASRANPSSHIVMSDIGALRTNRRVADRPSFPVLGSSSHASGSKSAISTNSKSKIRFTRRAGSVVSGSNDGCDDIGGNCKCCTSGGPVASSGVKVSNSVPVGTGALAVTWLDGDND